MLQLGAKRFGIVGVGPIGCCPIIRIQSANEECPKTMNVLAKRFNLGLKAVMKKLSLKGAKPIKYSIANSYEMTLNVLNNPLSYSKHTFSIIYNLYPKYKYYTYNSKPSNYIALTNLNLHNRYLRIFVLNLLFFLP